ncbi:hypothetical protein [Natronomonas sp. EA1]|uniref:hypothetical protein n=1 Tax=Natronomonas sp. EA1 TaxID=3421655 RepID=UPI003EB883FF
MSRRFALAACGQAFVVAVLAGLVGAFANVGPFGGLAYTELTEPAVRLSHSVVLVAIAFVAALYVLLPVATTVYLVRYGDRDPLVYGAVGALALLGVPSLGLFVWTLGFVDGTPLVAKVGYLAVLFGAIAIAYWYGRSREDGVETGVPLVQFLNLPVVTVALAGLVLGVAVSGAASGLVVEQSLSGAQVAFDYEYEAVDDERGLLTVTHDGGDTVPARYVHLEGDITPVANATQTEDGRWQGDTSTVSWRDGPVIAEGDSVRVGVPADCTVRVVYRREGVASTIALVECADLQ